MKSKYIKVGEYNIHYLDGGEGETVVLLSSLAITSRSYRQFGEKLASKYRVVIPDLGEGRSSGRKLLTSLNDYVSLLKGFLEAIRIDKFHLIGFSFGGLIALGYYKKHPLKIKSLFLTSTTLVPIKGRLLFKGYPCLLFKNLFSKNGFKVNLLWFSDGLVSFIRHPRQFLNNLFIGFKNLEERPTALEVPNILVIGDKDEFIPIKSIKEMGAIKGVNLEIIKAGHGWFFLKPEYLIERVERFFETAGK